jgi:hypothetical protein
MTALMKADDRQPKLATSTANDLGKVSGSLPLEETIAAMSDTWVPPIAPCCVELISPSDR